MDPALIMMPQNQLSGKLVLEELDNLRLRMVEIATKLAKPSASSQVEKLEKKRRTGDDGDDEEELKEDQEEAIPSTQQAQKSPFYRSVGPSSRAKCLSPSPTPDPSQSA
ncbi:uncharacterized protein A4U43_C10F6330 [Asparagus officinalis]|uniref:Uncharacterized protein n=1 Tax=Asparagus officinalis TaxID=4686 RepID=A0A5P1E481_ASPOF|nr:uncharacterized protein A4U43_C10F6330 [Asparagus officinalis]